jgi:integrase
MIVLMALGIGMRISEINASIPEWFSKQTENVTVHIKEESFFTPKAGEDGVVPFSLELYNLLLKFRGDSDSRWFVPFRDEEYDDGRLRKRFEAVNRWLHEKGFNKRNPLHSLRKECGSIIAKKSGILEASKVLRNTVQVCAVHYAGIAELGTVDIAGSFEKKDPLEAAAKLLGITVEALKKKLA